MTIRLALLAPTTQTEEEKKVKQIFSLLQELKTLLTKEEGNLKMGGVILIKNNRLRQY